MQWFVPSVDPFTVWNAAFNFIHEGARAVLTMAPENGPSSQVYKFLNDAVTPATTMPAPVSPSYRVQNYAQILFMKWENGMSSGSKITVHDAQNQIEFHASREFSDLHTKGTLLDQSKNLIVSLKNKICASSNKWAAYRGENEKDADFSFTVAQEGLHESNSTFEIFLTDNQSKVPDFTVVGNVYKRNFTILYNSVVVAKVLKSPFYKRNECRITIYRGMDKAFTTSLILIIDQFTQQKENYSTGTAEAFSTSQQENKYYPTRTAVISGVQQEEEDEDEDDSTEIATFSDVQRKGEDSKKTTTPSDALSIVPAGPCMTVTNLTQFLVMQKNRFFDETVFPYFISLVNRYTGAQQGYNRIFCYEYPPNHGHQEILPSLPGLTMADSVPYLPVSSPFRTTTMVLAVIVLMMLFIGVLGLVIFTMAAFANFVIGMMMVFGMVVGAIIVFGVGLAIVVGIVTGAPLGFVGGGDPKKGTAELNVRKFHCRLSYHLSNGTRLGMVEIRYKRFSCNFSYPL